VKLSDVARLRLGSQHLTGGGLHKPSDVVRKLGAIQAQDYAGAKWAVAQRTRSATDAAVEQELIDGAIIRTHVLRPTWHFVAPSYIRWMLALTAPRVNTIMSYYNRTLELDDAVFRRSGRALERALRDGKHLMRAEISSVLERARVNVAGEYRLGRLLMRAELDGIICSGARRGNQFTYALLAERVPATAPLDRDEALLRLTMTYFATRGPATPADFAWWSGLTVADARRGIGMAGSALEQVTVDGRAYWLAPSVVTSASPSRVAFLLPNYDEYFIAYRDRSALGQRLRKDAVDLRVDAVFANIVVVDGQLVGTWKRIFEGAAVVVELTPLASFSKSERKAVDVAAEKYGSFLNLPMKLATN